MPSGDSVDQPEPSGGCADQPTAPAVMPAGSGGSVEKVPSGRSFDEADFPMKAAVVQPAKPSG